MNQLLIQQKKIAEKIEDVKKIIELRDKNKMSLRKIGKEVGMSGQNVNNLLKQFGLE